MNTNVGSQHIASITYYATILTLCVAVSAALLQIGTISCDIVESIVRVACCFLGFVVVLSVVQLIFTLEILSSLKRPYSAICFHLLATVFIFVAGILLIDLFIKVGNHLLTKCDKPASCCCPSNSSV